MSRVTPRVGAVLSGPGMSLTLASALVAAVALTAFPVTASAEEAPSDVIVTQPVPDDPRAAAVASAQLQETIVKSAAPAPKKPKANFQSRTQEAIRATRSASMFRWGTAAYAKWYAKAHIAAKYEWGPKQFGCLVTVWNRESSWRYLAKNTRGKVYGIPQTRASTISSMGMTLTSYMRSPELQVQAGAKYINYRYGSPCEALSHVKRRGWY